VKLADIKKTNREKDYVVIGELARKMDDPKDQILYSRSARDLINLAHKYPQILESLSPQRPLLKVISQGLERLEQALDAERRALIHENERRIRGYIESAQAWSKAWVKVEQENRSLSLIEAHRRIVEAALVHLPFQPEAQHG
jgi:hypothetical protein